MRKQKRTVRYCFLNSPAFGLIAGVGAAAQGTGSFSKLDPTF